MTLLNLVTALAVVVGAAIDEVVRKITDLIGRRRARPAAMAEIELRRKRFANVLIEVAESRAALTPVDPLPPGTPLVMLVSIDGLRPDSAVAKPVPFPEHLLPQSDVWLDVLLSSADFAVSNDQDVFPRSGRPGISSAATARLLLPRDRGPARTQDGSTVLPFRLLASTERGPARARLSYYYRDAVIQSQRIDAIVGAESSQLAVHTDFTTSQSLTDLEAISDRPRVSVVLNSGPGDGHRVVVRPPSSHKISPDAGEEIVVSKAVQGIIEELRDRLSTDAVAPTTLQRSKDQLINDLRQIAPIGWRLQTAFLANAGEVAFNLLKGMAREQVLHVCRTSGSDLTLPWHFLYQHRLPEKEYQVKKVPICPVVDTWNEKDLLVSGAPWACPAGPHQGAILCPYGFLGFHQSIEVLTHKQKPREAVSVPADARIAVLNTLPGKKERKKFDTHLGEVTSIIAESFPNCTIGRGESRETIEPLLVVNQPLIYFYGHGVPGAYGTYLAFSANESISPEDFMGLVWDANVDRPSTAQVWANPQPLVFINTCHSLQLTSEGHFGWLDAFIGGARAAGVIGTEVKVNPELAAQFAASFMRRLLRTRPLATVDIALHETRMEFLAHGNLLGLAYTPYCWADLSVGLATAA